MASPGKSYRVGISLVELFDMFPNEAAARKWFEETRWPDGRACPMCGSVNNNEVPNERPMPYWCSDCRSYFSVKTGTVMRNSNLPMRKWAIAIYLVTTQGNIQHEAPPRPEYTPGDGLAYAAPYPQGHWAAAILCSTGR